MATFAGTVAICKRIVTIVVYLDVQMSAAKNV